MDLKWSNILERLEECKVEFDKSYKCLNRKSEVKKETVEKHIKILIENFNKIRSIINAYFNKLSCIHKSDAEKIFWKLRDKLLKVFTIHGINIKVSQTLNLELKIEKTNTDSSDSDEDSLLEIDQNQATMPQTIVELLNIASKLIPEFDGKSENLQSFVDSLALVETIKESHENVAVELVKIKLKGTARNLISSESTLSRIITKLKISVKGEPVAVITANMMNIKQNKPANAYVKEKDDLTKALTNAYIADGVTLPLAEKYSTQTAVRAMTKNAINEKVKIVMESGQFSTMNDAVAKFVNTSTEEAGQNNLILHINRNNFQNRNFRGRGRGRGRNNFNQTHLNQNQNYYGNRY